MTRAEALLAELRGQPSNLLAGLAATALAELAVRNDFSTFELGALNLVAPALDRIGREREQ